MDFAKVADIICPIMSCKDCEIENVSLNPYEKSHSFDDLAYLTLKCLRIQSFPTQLCLL